MRRSANCGWSNIPTRHSWGGLRGDLTFLGYWITTNDITACQRRNKTSAFLPVLPTAMTNLQPFG
jgi:hypothetical protein